MTDVERKTLFKTALCNLQFYDSLLREFEYVNLTFDIVLSAACFGQLKRHRMASLIAQDYDPALGITVPAAVKAIGREEMFRKVAAKAEEVYRTIGKKYPMAAPYILTNAHRRRILMRVNAREMYHISRLREDAHAQWDIQQVVGAMSAQAKKAMPLVFSMIGGKDCYNELYQKLYGKLPKVTEAVLPQARQIH
jgi:thymidylate synthase ThyX